MRDVEKELTEFDYMLCANDEIWACNGEMLLCWTTVLKKFNIPFKVFVKKEKKRIEKWK